MPIQPSEFYISFTRLFQDYLQTQTAHIEAKYQDTRLWTEFMLGEFLPNVIDDAANNRFDLACRREFKSIDLVAWDNIAERWNQTRHDLPLYVHLMIEHENGPYPNQEFWKLLYQYAPLKVLICYLPPTPTQFSYWLDWFQQMHNRVCAFHPRSVDDAYLLIIGRHDAAEPANLDWQGYELQAGQQEFAQVN